MNPAAVGVALADTSLFVAVEQERPIRAAVPESLLVSVVTVGEMRLGVLAAATSPQRARRLQTLRKVEALESVPIDDSVADAWASLRVALRERGRRMPVNDSWIAATAIALGIPVATQDADYQGVPGLDVVAL